MFAYFLIIIFIVILVYQYDIKKYHKYRLFWERFLLVLLIVVVGIRYHIGSDSIIYEWEFNSSLTPQLHNFFKQDNITHQILWKFVNSFCKTVFNSFIPVQFFHAIIFHTLAFRFIKKTTQYTFVAMLFMFILLWFANSFEVLRESISATIFLNSLFLLKDKKIIKYILCAFFAMGFHSFAPIIFIIAPIIMFTNIIVLATISVLLFITLQFIDFSYVNQLIINVMTVSDAIGSKALLYVGEKDATIISTLGLLRWFLLGLFLPICVIVLTDKKKEYWTKYIILWLLLTQLTTKLPILYRMDNYFELIYIVLLTNILFDKTRRNILLLRPILIILSVFVLIMGFWDVYRPDRSYQSVNVSYDIRYFPYKTIFQEPDPLRESQIRY